MKTFCKTFAVILLFIGFLLTLNTYRKYSITRDLKKEEESKIKRSAEILNKCFDLKNKSQRTLNESMDLIEYCLKEYGSKR